MRKQVTYILELQLGKMKFSTENDFNLELLDIEEQGTEFCFRKLKFITIYNA